VHSDAAQMSKITNDDLTRSDTGCFIAVPMWQQWMYSAVYCVNNITQRKAARSFIQGPTGYTSRDFLRAGSCTRYVICCTRDLFP